MFWWWFAVALFMLFWFLESGRRNSYWTRRGLRGPVPSPFFGHYWQLKLANKSSLLRVREWTRQFGSVFGLVDGRRNILVVSELGMVHELLVTKFDLFEARKLNSLADECSEFNASSILHATSFRWKRLRNIAATFFNAINVKKSIPALVSCTEELAQFLGSQGNKEEVDILPLLQELTDRITVRLIFGDSIGSEQPYLAHMFRALDAKKRCAETFCSALAVLMPAALSPVLRQLTRLRGNSRHNASLFRSLEKRVERARAQRTSNVEFTYLNHLLSTHAEERAQEKEKDNDEFAFTGRQTTRYLSTEEIVAACMNFLYAGHKTSGIDVRANRAYALFGPRCSRLHESLRLFPLGSEHAARKCMASTKLGGPSGVRVQRGDFVMVDVLSVHLSTALWGPDAAQFNPARWLSVQPPCASRYLSFGQGPRMCLGEKLALLQLKTVCALLLRRFTFRAVHTELSDVHCSGDMQGLMHERLLVSIEPNADPNN